MMRLIKAFALISGFVIAGFLAVKLVFVAICRFGGHYTLEDLVGFTTPLVLGTAIGIETFLWFREWRRA